MRLTLAITEFSRSGPRPLSHLDGGTLGLAGDIEPRQRKPKRNSDHDHPKIDTDI